MAFHEYLGPLSDPLEFKKSINKAVRKLSKVKDEFDAIALIGCSGYFGAPLALRLQKPLILVRKEDDAKKKCNRHIESSKLYTKYLFVDDLIDCGTTITRVINQISKDFPSSECVGVYLYNPNYGNGRTSYIANKLR